MDHLQYITRDPQICGGDYIIRGTRITLRTLLASIAAGDDYAHINKDYPAVTPEILLGIVAFAAEAAKDSEPVLPNATKTYCTNCLPFDYYAHFDQSRPGAPVVLRGTNITISSLLARIANGELAETLLAEHAALTTEHIRAAIAFAADSAEDEMPRAGLAPEFGGAMALLARIG